MSKQRLTATPDPAAILIFGYGNPSRGDDALGPLFIDRLEQSLTPQLQSTAGGIECLTDFQLQIEHALDLVGRRLVLFVDAHLDCPPPWQFTAVQPEAGMSYSTHAISPSSVLRIYGDIHDEAPPPAFMLAIRGSRFDLGEPLSRTAEDNLSEALVLVKHLCRHPRPDYWLTRIQPQPASA